VVRRSNIRISPASLLALVALFVALGGVSYAAATIDGKSIQNNSIPGKKLKNKAITNKKVKPGTLAANRLTPAARASLKGAQGQQGPAGPLGPAGPQGPQGPQGPGGTALAYAQVNDGGGSSLVAARTTGFSGVTRVATGTYCLALDAGLVGQAFTAGTPTRPTVASVEYGNTDTQTDQLIVEPRGANADCSDNTFEVHTYRNGAAADDVSFTLIVP
jgi:hypothetical protein